MVGLGAGPTWSGLMLQLLAAADAVAATAGLLSLAKWRRRSNGGDEATAKTKHDGGGNDKLGLLWGVIGPPLILDERWGARSTRWA